MPSFDIVSQYDQQEVRNAVDQTEREINNRFDFKGTNSEIQLTDDSIQIDSSTEDRPVSYTHLTLPTILLV